MHAAAEPSQPSATNKGFLICLMGTMIWSMTGILIRYLTEVFSLPPLVLAVWRDIVVTLGLALGLTMFRPSTLKINLNQVKFLVSYGLILALFNTSWTFSVALNGAAVATVLVYSAPAFTALMGWRLFAERLGSFKVGIISTSIIGCILVAGAYRVDAWQVNLLGILTGLLSGLMFSFYSLMGKIADRRGMDPWGSLTYAFGFASLFLCAFFTANNFIMGGDLFENLFWLGSSAVGWGVLVLLGLGPTIGGYGLYTMSLSYLPMSVASLVATLEPAFTAILAYVLLAERLTEIQLGGSLLVLVSVLVLRFFEGKQKPRSVILQPRS